MSCFTATGMAQDGVGVKVSNMDLSVSPGESFYDYACGGWVKDNPLPAAYSRFGSFDVLQQQCEKQMTSIIQELSSHNYAKGTNEQKISDYYKLAMDSVRRNKEGYVPVKKYLDLLANAKTKAQLEKLEEEYAFAGLGQFYGTYIGADEKDSKNNVLNVFQAGIALGEKEYYIDTDSATTSIREAYKKYIERIFGLYGFSAAEAQQKMQDLMYIETELAKASRNKTQLRDPQANYNKMTIEEFESKYPNLRLSILMAAQGMPANSYNQLVVGQPEFMERANSLKQEISADQLRTYMQWELIKASCTYLSDEINEAHFDFFGRTISGRQ